MADPRMQVNLGTANTPAVSSAATALAANTPRCAFMIVNLGTNPLYVRYGDGCTTSLFHIILKGSTVQDDGTGGSLSMEEAAMWTGSITVAGTSPRYVATELTA